jgi:hypothetical protein
MSVMVSGPSPSSAVVLRGRGMQDSAARYGEREGMDRRVTLPGAQRCVRGAGLPLALEASGGRHVAREVLR